MPLHFGSVTNDSQNSALLAHLVGPVLQRCDRVFVTPDKKYFIAKADMLDKSSGDVTGEFVFTIWANHEEKRNEILDLDITLSNPVPTELHFLERLEGSSDANEYWDVETVAEEQHLQIETVSRHTVNGDVSDEKCPAYISAFPFSLSFYDDIDTFNRMMGFSQISVGDTGLAVSGLSETFLAPGSIMSKNHSDEIFSFVLGTVESFRDVSVDMGETQLNFVLAQVKTGLGTIPVAMGRSVFDLDDIAPGKLIAMNADIKADMARPGVFHKA